MEVLSTHQHHRTPVSRVLVYIRSVRMNESHGTGRSTRRIAMHRIYIKLLLDNEAVGVAVEPAPYVIYRRVYERNRKRPNDGCGTVPATGRTVTWSVGGPTLPTAPSSAPSTRRRGTSSDLGSTLLSLTPTPCTRKHVLLALLHSIQRHTTTVCRDVRFGVCKRAVVRASLARSLSPLSSRHSPPPLHHPLQKPHSRPFLLQAALPSLCLSARSVQDYFTNVLENPFTNVLLRVEARHHKHI